VRIRKKFFVYKKSRKISGRASHGPAVFIADLKVKIVDHLPPETLIGGPEKIPDMIWMVKLDNGPLKTDSDGGRLFFVRDDLQLAVAHDHGQAVTGLDAVMSRKRLRY
jgi:hypothetical protein